MGLFLLSNWKWIVPVLCILGLVFYIETLRLEVSHYKKEVGQLNVKIGEYEVEAQRKSEIYSTAADALTKKYEDKLDSAAKAQAVAEVKLLNERIAHNAELKRITLTNELIQLWNASKSNGTSDATTSKPGDVSTPSTDQEVVKTLADLYLVSAENDRNHQACITNLVKWQGLWKDLEGTVQNANQQGKPGSS